MQLRKSFNSLFLQLLYNFIQIFNQNITYQPSMKKKRIFLSVLFTVFFRLPIYESIAAIVWQSASYVFLLTAVL